MGRPLSTYTYAFIYATDIVSRLVIELEDSAVILDFSGLMALCGICKDSSTVSIIKGLFTSVVTVARDAL